MTKKMSTPRAELSPFAPFILSMKIATDRIREVIGK